MRTWLVWVAALLVSEVVVLAATDGAAAWTMGLGASLVLTALVASRAPRAARHGLLLATCVFAAFVAGRLDALPARAVVTLVVVGATAWAVVRARRVEALRPR